jgi:hypothetical protein
MGVEPLQSTHQGNAQQSHGVWVIAEFLKRQSLVELLGQTPDW